MKYNPQTPLVDYANQPIVAPVMIDKDTPKIGADGKTEMLTLTLSWALKMAVNSVQPKTVKDKIEAFDLGLKVHSENYSFTSEEVSDLKRIIGETNNNPLIVGRVHQILESPIQD